MLASRFFVFVVLVLLSAVLVTAQDPADDDSDLFDIATPTQTGMIASGTSMLTECMKDCLIKALSSGKCASYTDLACVCTDMQYQSAAATCLAGSCTSEDVDSAEALQKAQCDAYVTPVSSTAASSGVMTSMSMAVHSSSAMGTSSGTASGAGASASGKTSDAVRVVHGIGKGWMFGIGAMALCLVGGGVFVL